MSTFVFKIACPRCDTAVNIYLGQSEYHCSRCAFSVQIEDSSNLLGAFKNGEVEDLDFVEAPIKQAGVEVGLKLSFSRLSDHNGGAAAESHEVINHDVDEDEFGNKTANTQIIQLTFDPAQYLDEMKDAHSPSTGKKKKKISLKKVIKYAETAKPPKPSSSQVLVRNCIIGAMILATIIIVVFLVLNK